MKPVQLPGHPPDKWLIDLEFSPWSPRVMVLRTEGHTGTAIYFDSEADARAKIAELEAAGEQARILKYAPEPAEPVTDAPRRGRPPKNG